MKRRIGTLCVLLGTVLLLAALSLLGYNQWEADKAQKASSDVLEQLMDALEEENGDSLSPDEYADLAEKRQAAGTEDTDEELEVRDMTLFTCTTGGKTRCAVRCQLVMEAEESGEEAVETESAG